MQRTPTIAQLAVEWVLVVQPTSQVEVQAGGGVRRKGYCASWAYAELPPSLTHANPYPRCDGKAAKPQRVAERSHAVGGRVVHL